jgi:hypothetical protein
VKVFTDPLPSFLVDKGKKAFSSSSFSPTWSLPHVVRKCLIDRSVEKSTEGSTLQPPLPFFHTQIQQLLKMLQEFSIPILRSGVGGLLR